MVFGMLAATENVAEPMVAARDIFWRRVILYLLRGEQWR
jgi:hypothetical protein